MMLDEVKGFVRMLRHISRRIYADDSVQQARCGRSILLAIAVVVFGPLAPHSILSADDPPPRCASGGELQSISFTGWESGLQSWTAGTHDVEKPSTFDTGDWAVTGNLPAGRAGMAAFVANIDEGDCASDDESGALSLDSPPIVLPGNIEVPQISLHHWYHIEYGWDGGNLQISVNGGAFSLIPASAIEYGSYNDTLFPAEDEFGVDYNTNPLAGEDAYTGPEEGESATGWEEVRVNLLGIAEAGDTIRLRLDFGVDGCDGEVGWYVDDIEVYSCVEALPTTSLKLVKQVVNNDGGTAQASAWTLTAAGPTTISGPGPMVSSGDDFQPGTYTLSESGGPPGYIASGWSCSGGDLVDADSVVLEAGDNATCTITNNDIAVGHQINFGHAGAWYFPATSGQGQFIDIEPERQFMFIGWFTYTGADSEDPLEQDWLTAEGFYSGNTAELTLYETSGGEFDDPQAVTSVPVGEVIVEFSDCDTGTLTYDFDTKDLEGEFPLQRVIPGSGNVCFDQEGNSLQEVDINVGMDGGWYEPATSGQGFFIDVHDNGQGGNFVFLSWFTYGETTASGRRWLTAEGQMDGSSAELVIYDTNGGAFDDPLPPESVVVGSMTLEFIDCDDALLTYSLTDEDLEGEIPITRVVPLGEAYCEELTGAE